MSVSDLSFLNWAWPLSKVGVMATGSSKVASPNTELGEDYLGALHALLYEIRSKYASFGIQLGLKESEIDGIEAKKGDPGRCLLGVLSICLRRAKSLTWNDIYNALISKPVNESKLAKEIWAKYLFVSDSSSEHEFEQEHEIKSEGSKKITTKKQKGEEKIDESQSEPEEVLRKKSKRKKKATHDMEVSVKGYGDRDHDSDGEVCDKSRKKSNKHSNKRKVYTESESEASSDEEEIDFEDGTSHEGKVTKHTEVKKRYPQKERRKNRNKKGAKSHDIRSSDEGISTNQKLRKSNKVETESEDESSFASSSDEEEIAVHKSIKKFKHTETESAARTKDTTHESEKTSGKKRVPKSALAKASPCPEQYNDKGRKKEDEKVSKSNKETYHKTRLKPLRNETEGRDGKREVVSEKKAKKTTAVPLLLPSSEMAQTVSGDGESDESSEDENESEQQSSDEEEETENGSTAEEKEEKGSEKSEKNKGKATHLTTKMRKTKSQGARRVKGSKAAGAPSKDDSDAGGSRDQEDQPRKRNRRRHRDSYSKGPIVRGSSSPSSSQEERKPGSRRQRRTHKHGGKYKRKEKKKRRKTSSSSSDTDSSSPESGQLKNLTKSEKKKLRKVFKYSFGQLCSASFNPVETAVQLQKKGLISSGMMMDIIRSPESQQEKIIRLVCGLDNRIRSRPERLFGCIEVLLENDALQEVGREMLRETGKLFTHQAQGMFVMICIPHLCRCNMS